MCSGHDDPTHPDRRDPITVLVDSWSDDFVASLTGSRRQPLAYAQTPGGDDYVMATPEPPSFLAADRAPYWATISPAGAVTFRPDPPTTADIHAAIGGYLELVPGTGRGWAAYCNEDGIRLGLAPNPYASRFFGTPLLGTVALVGPETAEGMDPLPAAIRARLVHEVIEA